MSSRHLVLALFLALASAPTAWADARGQATRYRALFDWLGTDDFSAWAVVPDALRLVGGLERGG